MMEYDNCHFATSKGCTATTYKNCPANCKFFKTDKEHYAGLVRAQELLAAKGLTGICKQSPNGGEIISTEEVGR